MTAPDTYEAVRRALHEHRVGGGDTRSVTIANHARKAIAADRKALADAGYEIVKRGSVPSWMTWCASVTASADNNMKAHLYMGHEDIRPDTPLYRLINEGDEKQ